MTPAQIKAAIAKLKPGADQGETLFGIPSSFTIAQACLESNWLTSMLSVQGNNLFGVKADVSWKGDVLSMPTREESHDGVWSTVVARWRKYASVEQCLTDHAQFFIRNPRYHLALLHPHDGKQFADEVAKAGYATDLQYASKLHSVINAHNLTDVGSGK